MWHWIRRRRAYAKLVSDTAAELLAAGGREAWGEIYRRSRERGQSENEHRFNLAISHEMERRIKIDTSVDTATRYMSQDLDGDPEPLPYFNIFR